MKNRNPLQTLKDGSAGRAKLEQMIGEQDRLNWLSDQLRLLPPTEGPASWKKLLLTMEEELRLLAVSSDTRLRYQALSILTVSRDETSLRLMWEALEDSEPEIRILMVNRFTADDRHKLFNRLYRIYLRDSDWNVRSSARRRIRRHFSDLFTINPENLDEREKIHCLELLDRGSAMDQDLAIRFLREESPGIVLTAALYLEREGHLDRLIREGSDSDTEDLSRRLELLKASARRQVTSFMDREENFQSPGALYLAVELLSAGTESAVTEKIIDAVFRLTGRNAFVSHLREEAARCLLTRKRTESYILLSRLLKENRSDVPLLDLILNSLPPEGAFCFYPLLLEFLKDPDFPAEESLLNGLLRFPASCSLRDLHDLVRDETRPAAVRKRALSILCRFDESSTLLFTLENLPLLNREEMRLLGSTAARWGGPAFTRMAGELLDEQDGPVRQSLLTLLAVSGNREFIPRMEEALTDASPRSRITALWALTDLNNRDSTEKMLNLLYDPEELVRSEAVRAFTVWNREDVFAVLSEILGDEQESLTVKKSLIETMGISENLKTIGLPIPFMESRPELNEIILNALLSKREEKELTELVRHFESGTPRIRESLGNLFREMGEPAESVLIHLIRSGAHTPLHPYISQILDQTGYVDSRISCLKSPSVKKRLRAAEDLSLIGTYKACRGLVFAARDISREIRILSIRALDKLNSDDSESILESLKHDPDKKVRKYTLWALERIRAGKLP